MKTYTTRWRQGDKKGVYNTKSLTRYHRSIHDVSNYAVTVENDHSVPDWPFGLYAEIIALTDDSNPKKNKPFPDHLITKK